MTGTTADAPLQKAINKYVKRGYRVMSQTETSAQLVKPKKFSMLWAIPTFGFYIFYHILLKKEKTVYLTITPDGLVSAA